MDDDVRAPLDESELDDLLSAPSDATLAAARQLGGDVIVLGAGGKMGPSLAMLAQRSIRAAGLPYSVHCVSRFGSPGVAQMLAGAGIRVTAADLLQPGVLQSLPDTPNVIFMAGMKFGSNGAEPLTWMLNTFLPGLVAERFTASRIVVLSTGNIYPFVPVESGGATEATPPEPRGEYAMSCLGRERMFGYVAQAQGTPIAILRLNYANDLRYGVLHDIARRILAGDPIDLGMSAVNLIWQGDANRVILQAFSICASPARVLNLAGLETVAVRWLGERFGELLGRAPVFIGTPGTDALLSNAAECCRLFGLSRVGLMQMIDWTAQWVLRGGRSLSKPTHFETRDGKF